jgi:hypothetical protein
VPRSDHDPISAETAICLYTKPNTLHFTISVCRHLWSPWLPTTVVIFSAFQLDGWSRPRWLCFDTFRENPTSSLSNLFPPSPSITTITTITAIMSSSTPEIPPQMTFVSPLKWLYTEQYSSQLDFTRDMILGDYSNVNWQGPPPIMSEFAQPHRRTLRKISAVAVGQRGNSLRFYPHAVDAEEWDWLKYTTEKFVWKLYCKTCISFRNRITISYLHIYSRAGTLESCFSWEGSVPSV